MVLTDREAGPSMIKIIVNEDVLARLATELGIRNDIYIEVVDSDDPGIKASIPKGYKQILGDASRLNHIRLVVGYDDQMANRLVFAHNKIVGTLLHEIKHLQQFQDWSAADWERDELYEYGVSPAEAEANEFAAANIQKWRGIISLKRPVRSTLSKLSVAEQNVRKSR